MTFPPHSVSGLVMSATLPRARSAPGQPSKNATAKTTFQKRASTKNATPEPTPNTSPERSDLSADRAATGRAITENQNTAWGR